MAINLEDDPEAFRQAELDYAKYLAWKQGGYFSSPNVRGQVSPATKKCSNGCDASGGADSAEIKETSRGPGISCTSPLGLYLSFTKASDLIISEFHNHHNARQENHQIIPKESLQKLIDNPESTVLVDWQQHSTIPHILS